MKSFESYHPIVIFVYFLSVILMTVFTLNPLILACSYLGAVCFCGLLTGWRKLSGSLACSIPLMGLMAVTNPLFVHRGETVLFFLGDHPITLEAFWYGVAVAFMIEAVFYWFKCYRAVMTEDKVLYLFGKTAPKLSLLLSMILNFVPRFRQRFREIEDAQKALGFLSSDRYWDKIRGKMRVFSILVTWSLENSVELADSMNARGYGLKGRTCYSVFRITVRDCIMGAFVCSLAVACCVLLLMGKGKFDYYPTVSPLTVDAGSAALYGMFLLLSFCAFISEGKENLLWHYLKSKI